MLVQTTKTSGSIALKSASVCAVFSRARLFFGPSGVRGLGGWPYEQIGFDVGRSHI